MRDALKELEGQLVMVEGVVAKGNVTKNGSRHFCVSNPRVTPWDGMSKLKSTKGQPPVADHMWVQCDKTSNWPKLYTKHFCIGTVGWYARADGSIDLTVRDLARLMNGDKVLWNIEYLLYKSSANKGHLTEAASNIGAMLQALLDHGKRFDGDVRYVYSPRHSYKELAEKLTQLHEEASSRQFSEILPSLHGLRQAAVPGSAVLLHNTKPARELSAVERLLGEA